ncbi:MAG: hypothetical protein AAGM84_08420 [Pseudomonadota bacterium]
MRLPLPFDGFAALVAASAAAFGTVTLVAWMPRRWVWSDAELLRQAFQARHGVTASAAGSALGAITQAHQRATALRGAAKVMRDDAAAQVIAVADRLDAAAHEIFYAPERHGALRAVLIRSELIEDAARAHAQLRARNQAETEAVSRGKLLAAVSALDAAFDTAELNAARGLLTKVEVASEVAESLLKPRSRR